MKKLTMLSGITSSLLVLIGVIFKAMHWPGAGVIILIGITIFAAAYALLLFRDKQEFATTTMQKVSNVFVMMAMVLISLGFLFKIQHWPGAAILIYVSEFALLVLIPVMFVQTSKEKEPVKQLNFYNEAILLIILFAFSLFLLLVMN